MAVIYLTIEQAIDTHRKTVEVSGGGIYEHLNVDKLASVLEHIQNDEALFYFQVHANILFAIDMCSFLYFIN